MFQEKQTNSFSYAQEALVRIYRSDIPPTWHVFRISRRKLLILLLCFLAVMIIIMGFLESYLLVNFDHHPPVPSTAFYAINTIIFLFITGSLALIILIWENMKNVVLVLTPEGFVRGNHMKLMKALHISYQNIIEMYDIGNGIITTLKAGNRNGQQVDCRLFEPSTCEVINGLITAYDDFRTKQLSKAKSRKNDF